jgi:anti-sigma regulatory factor (Ser/Thr protein kinase)
MLAGVAETVELDSTDLNDVRTAVTEACNNVVLHAYDGGEGPLEIEVYVSMGELRIVVRDRGRGIRAQPDAPRPADSAFGIGLPVIQALVHRVEFAAAQREGTEVRMEFATPNISALPPPATATLGGEGENAAALSALTRTDLAGTISIQVAPASLACTVLPRVLGVLAARAHFSVDRMSDTRLLADALIAHAPTASGTGRIDLSVHVGRRHLELRLGPLPADGARRLVASSEIAGVLPVIDKLTDRHGILTADSGEMLTLQLLDRR